MKKYYDLSKVDFNIIYEFKIKEKGTGKKHFNDKIKKEAKNER